MLYMMVFTSPNLHISTVIVFFSLAGGSSAAIEQFDRFIIYKYPFDGHHGTELLFVTGPPVGSVHPLTCLTDKVFTPTQLLVYVRLSVHTILWESVKISGGQQTIPAGMYVIWSRV